MKNLRAYTIVDFLKKRKEKYCSVDEMVRHFGVSPATMYRDIAELAAHDVIQKVRGGVALRTNAPAPVPVNSPFVERVNRDRKLKEAIAAQAIALVEENDILFLDSSTTVYFLARVLARSAFSSLTVITNSVTVMQEFPRFPAHYVRIGLGGSYDPQLNSFLGQATLRELGAREIGKAFVSAFGFGGGQATTNHEHHAALLHEVLGLAGRKWLLVDHGKAARSGLFPIAPLDAFDAVLTD